MSLSLWPNSLLVQYLLTFTSVVLLENLSSCFGSILSFVGKLLVSTLISWLLIKTIRKYANKKLIPSYKRAVIITGCDSGFGNATALKLNSNGFRVYATVLDPECKGAKDLLSARFPDMIRVMRMNVTNDGEVTHVYQQIKQELQQNGEELWAVVNNAGVCALAPLDWGNLDNYKELFEVNTYGTVRVSRTFLPLIIQSKGRVVNVVSMSGRTTVPYLAAYSMSKHAVLSFSDALRRENMGNISVSTIEPMAYQTSMTEEDLTRRFINKWWTHTSPQVKQKYGQEFYEGFPLNVGLGSFQSRVGKDISQVVDKIVDAIENREPEIYYAVGAYVLDNYVSKILQFLPTEISDFVYSQLTNKTK